MTNEEAQQLIAEIEKKHKTECGGYPCVCVSETAKIITRFANKPPYILPTHDSDRTIELRIFECDYLPDKVCEIKIGAHFNMPMNHITARLRLEELKQLRDNCTKMLEYLGDEND